MAQPSRTTLMTMAARGSTEGSRQVKPSLYFRPTAQAISNRPAKKRISQDIGITPLGENGVVPWIKEAFLKAAQAAEEARRGPARKNAGGVVPARRLLCTPEWVGQAAIRRREIGRAHV